MRKRVDESWRSSTYDGVSSSSLTGEVIVKFGCKSIGMAVAGAAMMVAPTMALAASPAASLWVTKARAGTTTSGNSKIIAEGATATYVSIGILAALVVGVLLATSGGSDDSDSN